MYALRRFSLLAMTIISYLSFAGSANADMEGRMPLAHIQFDSGGIDNSGPVHVEAIQDANGISELKVSAFGVLHTATKSQLAAIGDNEFNTVGMSYSRGYKNTGGRSVYILLCQGFSSGTDVVAVVTITEHGGIRVDKARAR